MGADLYIEDVEDYFRDSYNGTAVLWRFKKADGEHLSWWADVSEKLLDEDSRLKGDKLVEFRDLICNSQFELPTKEELEKSWCSVSDDGRDSLENWHTFFTEKRVRLLAFLNRAIELNKPILCSL